MPQLTHAFFLANLIPLADRLSTGLIWSETAWSSSQSISMTRFLLVLLLCLLSVAQADDTPTCSSVALASVVRNANLTLCKSAVDFTELTAPPTATEFAVLCKASACVSIMETILALNISDCVLPTGIGLKLLSEIVYPTVEYCEENGVEVAGGSDIDDSAIDAGDSGSSGPATAAGSASTTSSAVSCSSLLLHIRNGIVLVLVAALLA